MRVSNLSYVYKIIDTPTEMFVFVVAFNGHPYRDEHIIYVAKDGDYDVDDAMQSVRDSQDVDEIATAIIHDSVEQFIVNVKIDFIVDTLPFDLPLFNEDRAFDDECKLVSIDQVGSAINIDSILSNYN